MARRGAHRKKSCIRIDRCYGIYRASQPSTHLPEGLTLGTRAEESPPFVLRRLHAIDAAAVWGGWDPLGQSGVWLAAPGRVLRRALEPRAASM